MKNNFSVFFVTPDVKRGLGVETIFPNYHIITANDDYCLPALRKRGVNIFCLKNDTALKEIPQNSGQILENKNVLEYIKKNARGKVYIAFFKPSLKLDRTIEKYGFNKIGNGFGLNEIFENKVSGIQLIAGNYPEYILPFRINKLSLIDFRKAGSDFNLPLVIQFGHGWAGKTTFFISEEKEFLNLQKQFPQTLVRINSYLPGFTILNNAALYREQVFVSPPALQISGFKELSLKQGVTCGRQWPTNGVSLSVKNKIADISRDIGSLMIKSGFRGFFGLDFLIDENQEKVFLSDINARLTASASFYSQLELGLGSLPLLYLHFAEFLGIDFDIRQVITYENSISEKISGSQIIIRNIKTQANLTLSNSGQFKLENNKAILKNADVYDLINMKENELFYLKNKNDLRDNSELSRIETKMTALDSPRRLNDWLAKLIS